MEANGQTRIILIKPKWSKLSDSIYGWSKGMHVHSIIKEIKDIGKL